MESAEGRGWAGAGRSCRREVVKVEVGEQILVEEQHVVVGGGGGSCGRAQGEAGGAERGGKCVCGGGEGKGV